MPLHVQLLPTSAGDHSQTQSLTTFLVNGTIAIDAGSLGFSLSGQQLARVAHVILTHAHIDHVAGLPSAISEVFPHLRRPMRIYGTADVLRAVRDHILNGVIWPDFARINLPDSDQPAVEFVEIRPHEPFEVDGVRFTPIPVDHEVPTVGLIARTPDAAVAFTSDTRATDAIWAVANGEAALRAVFVDCSFPDELEQLAQQSGHLTPRQVAAEAAKLTHPAHIICVHIKPDTRDRVLTQLAPYKSQRIVPVEIGKTYEFNGTTKM